MTLLHEIEDGASSDTMSLPTLLRKYLVLASRSPEDVEIEPGADKRLANILKKALNTPPQHRSSDGPSKVGRKTTRAAKR